MKPKLPRVRVPMPPPKVIPNKKRDYDPYHDDGDLGAEQAGRHSRAGLCARCGHGRDIHTPEKAWAMVEGCNHFDANGPCRCGGFVD